MNMSNAELDPLFHTAEMLLSFPGIVSSLLLFFAVRTCTLHPNCKALIILWMASQIIMNVSIIMYSLIFIFVEREGAPDFIHTPYYRRKYVENSLRFYYVSCFFEFGISFERSLSMRKPQQYHLSSLSKLYVGFWSLISLLYGSLISHLITEGGNTPQCAIGTVVCNIVDVGAFFMNLSVYFDCKRRKDSVGETTLNGRYQVKEVYEITRAMLPVYCIGSVVKIPVATITWLFLFDIVSYAYSEIVCTVACVSSCGITSALFMRFHTVIRGRVARMCSRSRGHRPSLIVPVQSVEETTSAYFRIINDMWE